jgi:hypothetical protein
LSDKLHELGFTSSKADTSLFIFSHEGVTIYMLVYVDDIILAGSSMAVVERLVQTLAHTFPIKDLGRLEYFLGIEATYDSAGMVLNNINMLKIYYIVPTWRNVGRYLLICHLLINYLVRKVTPFHLMMLSDIGVWSVVFSISL